MQIKKIEAQDVKSVHKNVHENVNTNINNNVNKNVNKLTAVRGTAVTRPLVRNKVGEVKIFSNINLSVLLCSQMQLTN